MIAPEPILSKFKSYSTRALRAQRLLGNEIKPWARHGSTIYLWKEEDVARAVDYVVLGQDHPFGGENHSLEPSLTVGLVPRRDF